MSWNVYETIVLDNVSFTVDGMIEWATHNPNPHEIEAI